MKIIQSIFNLTLLAIHVAMTILTSCIFLIFITLPLFRRRKT